MLKERKIVICDKCGERFDYIPETCPKCGEILSARMDPDARKRIEKELKKRDFKKIILFNVYGIFGIIHAVLLSQFIFDFSTFGGILYILFTLAPIIIVETITIVEKTKSRSILLHLTFITYNLLILSCICYLAVGLMPFNDFNWILFKAIFTPLFVIIIFISITFGLLELDKKRITVLWGITIILVILISIFVIIIIQKGALF